MRIILRILAIAVWFAIIGTLLLVWRIWRVGTLGVLMASGIFGLITVLGWIFTMVAGPFGAVQLWRLRESGRRTVLLLAGYAFLYYFVCLFFFRQSGAANSKIWLALGGNIVVVALLLSSPVRRACSGRT
jgi:hypothetical protein